MAYTLGCKLHPSKKLSFPDHRGRPGKVGGSLPRRAGAAVASATRRTGRAVRRVARHPTTRKVAIGAGATAAALGAGYLAYQYGVPTGPAWRATKHVAKHAAKPSAQAIGERFSPSPSEEEEEVSPPRPRGRPRKTPLPTVTTQPRGRPRKDVISEPESEEPTRSIRQPTPPKPKDIDWARDLGVSPTATPAQVRAAHRKAMMTYAGKDSRKLQRANDAYIQWRRTHGLEEVS